ncbi:MAG: hypothetical protein ACE5KF_07520 [Kiloniellaceae bacterium]
MNELITLFAVVGALAAILANIALWAPRRLRIKIGALVTTAAFLPVAYASLAEMLSRPKPVGIEWAQRNITEATVLGSRMEEGEAIYLWLGIEGIDEPRAYVLPWDQQMARELHGAQRSAEQTGTRVQMRLPFEPSLDRRERKFYAAPPPPPPAKQTPAQSPLNYQRSETTGQNGTN